MSTNLKKSAKAVQEALDEFGYELNVVELLDSTRTAKEAANAIGCTIGQIVKSLIFKMKSSNEPVLILASGENRVNEKKVNEYIGDKLRRADPSYVLEHTGFAIGGIPPIGHPKLIATYIDEDLMEYEEIWAAAGTPNAVFKLTPNILEKITQGHVIKIK